MSKTFHTKKSNLMLGIVGVTLFTAAALGHFGLFFLREPEKEGFRNAVAAVAVGWAGVVVYGAIDLLSIYVLLRYRKALLSIDGTTITLQAVWRRRQFEPSEIQKLQWTSPRAKAVFHLVTEKATLDFDNFTSADQLTILRLFRRLVPDELQEGWPLFCYRVALYLRDGSRPGDGSENGGQDQYRRVLVTRGRYDVMFVLILPICVVLGGIAAWEMGKPLVLIPPIGVCFVGWALLRYGVPPEGRWETRASRESGGKSILLAVFGVVAAKLAMVGARLLGAGRETACSVGLAVIVPVFPFVIMGLYFADKVRKRREAEGILIANNVWLKGEST